MSDQNKAELPEMAEVLLSVGVVLIDDVEFILRCVKCGHMWKPDLSANAGQVPRGYLICPNGCNKDLISKKGEPMSKTIYTLGEITQILKCTERATRKLLNDAGADPRFDENTENSGELVSRKTVIDLVAIRAGDRVGRLLAGLLNS
jgi:hypothetical protein